MEERNYYVYILTNKKNGTLYTGVTNNLARRVYEHREDIFEGFTKRYNSTRLVYYEVYGFIGEAIYREKMLKHWRRAWKVKLIERHNPSWKDLYNEILG